jgi:nucleotide-binding universal stress UspA family protein
MLTSILAASDLTRRSTPAVTRALQLARDSGARLTLLHVVEEDLHDTALQRRLREAETLLAERVEGGAQVDVAAVAGHAFHSIGAQARARGAELIVMGAHRRDYLRDVFAGTTVERVTRTAGLPVLMVNAAPVGPWRRVVIATDLSETSGLAARRAHALGLLEGAEVSVVHGYAPITRQMMTFAGVPTAQVEGEAERELEATRREVTDFLEGLGPMSAEWGARIVEGGGAGAIAGHVAQVKADLLVIGTRGLSGVKRLFLGSVAQELMGSLRIDVLAVPPEE